MKKKSNPNKNSTISDIDQWLAYIENKDSKNKPKKKLNQKGLKKKINQSKNYIQPDDYATKIENMFFNNQDDSSKNIYDENEELFDVKSKLSLADQQRELDEMLKNKEKNKKNFKPKYRMDLIQLRKKINNMQKNRGLQGKLNMIKKIKGQNIDSLYENDALSNLMNDKKALKNISKSQDNVFGDLKNIDLENPMFKQIISKYLPDEE